MPIKKTLPTKLSDLLELAVGDARAMSKRRRRRYKLNMRVWHKPNGVCQVCMAGAVLARRGLIGRRDVAAYLDELRDKAASPDAVLAARLINFLREGASPQRDWDGLDAFPAAANPALQLIRGDYDFDRDGGRAKWSTYLKAAKMLREVGL